MSVIANISTAVPAYKHKQADIAEYMNELFDFPEQKKRRLRALYATSAIETRYSVLPDYSLPISKGTFFSKAKSSPDVEARMKIYTDNALSLSVEAINKCVKGKIKLVDITHLITVSCTGMYAPGLDVDIVQQLKLNATINRTSINFMGCYAAIHALKQADAICKSNPDAMVLIVCIELCSIHFQKKDDIDNITSNLLFADGASAALVVPDKTATKKKMHGFKIADFYSQVDLNGKADMVWQLSSTGFLMTLSKDIPQLIEQSIKKLFTEAARKLKIKKQDITHWAIHPGGKKILSVIQKELGLDTIDLESSYKTLRNYGNMSSPTILFVLKDMLDNKVKPNKPETIFCVAFGPGLTMESAILENV